MVIQSIRHKGLKRLITVDDASGLPAEIAPKLRRMVSFLLAAETPSELYAVPTWKAHMLIGSRQGTWSLHVTRNWRLTFWVDGNTLEIIDLDFEDYH
jgi:proteic killer suppression protein